MTDLTNQLKTARGRRYYDILKAILAEYGADLATDAMAIKTTTGKLTPVDVGGLALKYDLNLKAAWEWLEESRVIPTGTYDRAIRRGMKAGDVLRAAKTKKNSSSTE